MWRAHLTRYSFGISILTNGSRHFAIGIHFMAFIEWHSCDDIPNELMPPEVHKPGNSLVFDCDWISVFARGNRSSELPVRNLKLEISVMEPKNRMFEVRTSDPPERCNALTKLRKRVVWLWMAIYEWQCEAAVRRPRCRIARWLTVRDWFHGPRTMTFSVAGAISIENIFSVDIHCNLCCLTKFANERTASMLDDSAGSYFAKSFHQTHSVDDELVRWIESIEWIGELI